MPARKLALIATGKRKTAIARAVIRPGNGNIRINNIPLEVYQPEVAKWKSWSR